MYIVYIQLVVSSPSSKLLAEVHVGSLSGIVHNTNETPQHSKYQMYGAAVDVCRQIVIDAGLTIERYKVTVTKDAVDGEAGDSVESLQLVPASTCFVVCNDNTATSFEFLDKHVS